MIILSNLFGSELRVKMMRLFLFNPDKTFDIEQILTKTDSQPRAIEKELSVFKKIGLVKDTKLSKFKIVKVKKGRKTIEKKVALKGYLLDPHFKYRATLSEFLVKTHSLENKVVIKRLEKAGKIKAVLVSGIFTGNAESRFDLFVVGDNIKSASMDRVVKGIESDMGKDIRYAVLTVSDFAYRKSMNDKLVRDVIDYPHTVLLDKIGISPSR